MDQADLGYDDFVDKSAKGHSKGKRKPLLLILVITLIVVLLGIGGYAVWFRPDLLPFMAQLRPAPAAEATAMLTPEEPAATAVAGASVTDIPEPGATVLPPNEPPVESSTESILPAPEFGHLVQTRAAGDPGLEDRTIKLASNQAIREPYQWEYLEFDASTLAKDVERYYIDLLNKDMGYKLTFNDRYPENMLAIFKFKQDARRVTINFYEGQKDQIPSAFIFYEGW